MQPLKLFIKTIPLLAGVPLLLGFFLFSAPTVSADEFICECVLDDASSRCSAETAASSICVNNTFIQSVINQPGVDFDLRDFSGNDLDTVKVTDTLFRMRNTKKIYFSATDGAKINNDSLDIDITAAGSENSFVAFRNTDIGECSDWQTLYFENDVIKVCALGALEVGAKSLKVNATKAIYAKYRWFGVKEKVDLTTAGDSEEEKVAFDGIYVPEPVAAGNAVNISTAGYIEGGSWRWSSWWGEMQHRDGDIFAQPGWHQTGSAGSINLSAKAIYAGDISAIGYPDSGQLSVNAESAYLGDIALHSVKGWENEGEWTFSQDLMVPANQSLTVNNDIKYFRAREIHLEAADDIADLNITSSDRIIIREIYAYSGCIPGTVEEIKDYPGTSIEPRKICQVGDSGNINLTVTGESEDKGKGIWIDRGICNDAKTLGSGAYWDDDTVPDGEEYVGGKGFPGKIYLVAENGLVYIEDSIESRGFHRQKDSENNNIYDIYIKGRFIYQGLGIRAGTGDDEEQQIFPEEQQIFPEEIDRWPLDLLGLTRGDLGGVNGRKYMGGANIKIEPVSALDGTEGCNLGEKGGCYRGMDINVGASHPFASKGGRVEIKSSVANRSAYRVEAGGSFEIDTSGFFFSPADSWIIRNGPVRDPSSGNCFYEEYGDDFCNATIEYLDGLDAGVNKNCEQDQYSKYGDGLDGGDGGDVLVEAQIMQPNGGELYITSDGGHGSYGGTGGRGRYCYRVFEGDISHVIPQIGYGGRGGNGGNGGDIIFETKKIITTEKDNFHCFDEYRISNSGGDGNRAGDTRGGEVPTERMGACDLSGWSALDGTNQIPEIKAAPDDGEGGDAGDITLKPMPTDPEAPVEQARIWAHGGTSNNGFYGFYYPPAYPSYCENVPFDADDPNGPAHASKYGNGIYADEYIEEYKKIEMCKEEIYRSINNCVDECAGDSGCENECEDQGDLAISRCQYKDTRGNNEPPGDIGPIICGSACLAAGEGAPCCYNSGNDECDGWSYEDSKEYCRPKLPRLACMNSGFTDNERKTAYSYTYIEAVINSGDGLLDEIAEAKPPGIVAMIDGADGKNGGDGGAVEIDTEWTGSGKMFRVFGGEAGGGQPGQDSHISQPGAGGDGGNGGDAGSVLIWQPDDYVRDGFPSDLAGGEGGSSAMAGRAVVTLPRVDKLCKDDPYTYFWDWGVAPHPRRYTGCDSEDECGLDEHCDSGDGECVSLFACWDQSELVSCRTKEPFGDSYNVQKEEVLIDFGDNNGTQGENGTEASLAGISVNQASPGVCTTEVEDPIDPINWVEIETGCCNGIDDDRDGLIDCQDPDCEDECFNEIDGLLMNRAREEWEEECGVIICLDDHDNDNDRSVDIEDLTSCRVSSNKIPEVVGAWWEQKNGCDKDHPSVKLWWQYSDDDDDQQTKYEVEIETGGNVIVNGVKDGATNSVTYSDVGDEEDGHLKYNTQYSWRVRVFDGKDWSDWKEGEDFILTEWPRPQFDYQVREQAEGGEWISSEAGICSYEFPELCNIIEGTPDLKLDITANNTQSCNGCTYEWDFDGGGIDSEEETPEHTYTSSGNYVTRLTAKDDQDRSCYQEMGVDLGGSQETPKWWEIAPF